MKTQEYCFRCQHVVLRCLPESSPKMLFFECPTCHRHYAKGSGESLHDRWLNPITIPLYSIIFEQEPEQHVSRVAKLIQQQQPLQFIAMLLADIEEEIAHPGQKISELLPFEYPDEQRLRSFLAKLALELRLQSKDT